MKVATVMLSDPDTLDPGRADDDQKNSIVLAAQEMKHPKMGLHGRFT